MRSSVYTKYLHKRLQRNCTDKELTFRIRPFVILSLGPNKEVAGAVVATRFPEGSTSPSSLRWLSLVMKFPNNPPFLSIIAIQHLFLKMCG